MQKWLLVQLGTQEIVASGVEDRALDRALAYCRAVGWDVRIKRVPNVRREP